MDYYIIFSNFFALEDSTLQYSDIQEFYEEHSRKFRRTLNLIKDIENEYAWHIVPMHDANIAALANHRNDLNVRMLCGVDYAFSQREDYKKVLKIIKNFKNDRVIDQFNYFKHESPTKYRKLLQYGVDRHLYENKDGIFFGAYQKKSRLCNNLINDLSVALSFLQMEDLQILKDFSDENPQLFVAMVQPCMLYVLGNAVYVKSIYPLYNKFYGDWRNVWHDTFHKTYTKIYIRNHTHIAFPMFFFLGVGVGLFLNRIMPMFF